MTKRYDSRSARSHAAGRGSLRCALAHAGSDANGNPLDPKPALDDVLATLERSELSATEIACCSASGARGNGRRTDGRPPAEAGSDH